MLLMVPAAMSCSIATTPTPMMTVARAASMSVKPRCADRCNLVLTYLTRWDIGLIWGRVKWGSFDVTGRPIIHWYSVKGPAETYVRVITVADEHFLVFENLSPACA